MISNTKIFHLPIALVVLLMLSCCGDTDEPVSDQDVADQATIEAYLAENDSLAEAHESGIYYVIVDTVPSGTQAAGNIMSIFYSAAIMGGSEIDNITKGEEDSVMLKQGVDAIYPVGLDIGLSLMKEGETFRFYIPSSLAYGDYSSSLIPENSIIVIEVEVAAIHNVADIIDDQHDQIEEYIEVQKLDSTIIDSVFNSTLNEWVHTDTTLFHPLDSVEYLISDQIYFKRQSEGTAGNMVIGGESATISYIGTTLSGDEFDRRPFATPLTYAFGTGEIIEGLDAGISVMERNEEALIIIPSHKAYGESVFVIPRFIKQDFVDLEIIPQYAAKVNPYEVVIFETTLQNNP
ncbi:MAG: FKBP-type peptidyl-prolyl cis-trans isomerase [Reichenbachiella sp.]|uniref:FKBP-type peptidyl-prolyl cis-trans isomerase n=1 Tax=Reichenbachiella sp. TaxID=2184521 RepID=UPI00329891BE